MKTNMKSSSATEASLAMLANTTRDKNSKERESLIETYKKLIARTIIIILLHFYFIILHWSLMHL
jgi:DNA-directed RNA polymerase specialized sigma subunit